MKVVLLFGLVPLAAANWSNGSNGTLNMSNASGYVFDSAWMFEGVWSFKSPECKQRVLDFEIGCLEDVKCWGKCQNFTAHIMGACTRDDLHNGTTILEMAAKFDESCEPCMMQYIELADWFPHCLFEVCGPSPSEVCRYYWSELESKCKNSSATIEFDYRPVLMHDYLQVKPWCVKQTGHCGKISADLAKEIRAIPCQSGFGH